MGIEKYIFNTKTGFIACRKSSSNFGLTCQVSFEQVVGSTSTVTLLAKGFGSSLFEPTGIVDVKLGSPLTYILDGCPSAYQVVITGTDTEVVMTVLS